MSSKQKNYRVEAKIQVMASVCLGMFILICLLETSYGLTIRLIHRDSPESPLYQPNLTSSERVQKLVMQTKSRRFGGSNSSSGILTRIPLQSKVIRPHVGMVATPSPIYVAEVGIGTLPYYPSYEKYFLHVDPGSDILWLQCEDCEKPEHQCYWQSIVPVFPSSHSQTYNPLPCNQHELCYPDECIDGKCSYEVEYMDETRSLGFLAREKFTFPSSTSTAPHHEQVELVFGCGFYNSAPVFNSVVHNQIAGILGLGWGPRSFVNQIGSQSQGRFSYCLQRFIYRSSEHPPSTYLRFGSDIRIPSGTHFHTTTLYEYPDEAPYYVTLLGISVNNNRLQIPQHYFSKTREGGGCFIDSGTSFSQIIRPAYDILKQAVVSYIAKADISLFRTIPIQNFDLCFKRKDDRCFMRVFDLCIRRKSPLTGFKNLPNITFHFQGGADLELEPQSAFYAEAKDNSEKICLAMVPGDEATIIGGYSQTHKIFVFDTWRKQLSFGYQDCNQNP